MNFRRKISIFTAICIFVMLFSGMGGVVYADNGTNGLVAHYTFDGNLADSSGNGNNGTATGNISYMPGPMGQAAVFDGNSYITVKDSDSLDLGKQFTISAWIFNNNNEKVSGILQKQASEYNDTLPSYCLYQMGMWPYFSFYDISKNIDIGGFSSKKRLDVHEWDLLTVTYDGTTLKYYKNGDILSTEELPGGAGLGTSSGNLLIGMSYLPSSSGNNFFDGRLDDLRIYNKLLSQNEIKQLYSAAASGANKDIVVPPHRMVAYYSFNNDIKDHSGYGNNGEIAGGNIKYVDSVAGKGAYFNGSSYIDVKNSDSLNVDKGFTASAWVKFDNVKPAQYSQPIISALKASNNTNLDAYDFFINSSYSPLYHALFNFTSFMADSGNDSWNGSEAYNMMGPAVWSMATVTYDGKTAKYYMDGKLKSSVQADGNKGIINHFMGTLQIGHLLDRGEEYFTRGIIDELRIYNYTMSDGEVKTLSTYRDNLVVKASGNGTMSPKQSVQLNTSLSTYSFTPSATAPGTGKNEFNVKPLSGKVIFKSNTPKVVTASPSGKLTAIGKGKASITVTYGQLSKTLNVIVH